MWNCKFPHVSTVMWPSPIPQSTQSSLNCNYPVTGPIRYVMHTCPPNRANRWFPSVRKYVTVLTRCNSYNINIGLSDVGNSIVPLCGLVTHREQAYGIQSVISAPVKRMFWPGLCPRAALRRQFHPGWRHKRDTRAARVAQPGGRPEPY